VKDIEETQRQPILCVRDLTTAFRVGGVWKTVVDRICFEIGEKETLAVVGESGSGKSVTALSIMRLVSAINGRVQGYITLEGRSLLDLAEEEMLTVRGGSIGMIFQEPMTSLNPLLTVGFQVTEALRRHREMSHAEANKEALRLFDLVRIPDAPKRFSEFPHTFSGGMRQRVMIAISLACRPKLLIADEPTTALDVTIQAQILELIRDLQSEIGMSVMFITHDMGVVAEIADRVVVMKSGQQVEQASVTDLFDKPQHPYTRQLLSAVPKLGSLRGIGLPQKFPSVEKTIKKSNPQTISTEEAEKLDHRGETILEVSGLTTRFPVRGGIFNRVVGNIHAVEDVSFSLRSGETLALVGESGCGKSTTGRSILRLVEPNAGSIKLGGTDLMDLTQLELRQVRQQLQMIFQDPYGSLNPRKTIGASIREPIIVHGIAQGFDADKQVAQLLTQVGLKPEHATRFPHEFSGGQRQRICIARSLALKPTILVADESVSALDVSIKAQVINLMLDLQAEMGLSYLFISHDIAVVERISHRVAVMYLGQIVEIGPRSAVIENPKHPYTQQLMNAVPVPDPRQRRVRTGLMTEEINSPVRPLDFTTKILPMIEIGANHFVRKWE